MIRLLAPLFLLLTLEGSAQTVGLLSNTPDAFDGYTLVAPTGATRTHLIDNCGRVIRHWDSEFRAGESAYLLEDGSLLRTARQASTVFTGGGMGGREVPFNERGVLDDIKSRQLGYGEKPDYIGVAATLNFVRSEKLWYEACASEGCQKKVVQNTDGADSA